MSRNNKLNIILGIVCIVILIIILYMLNYKKNLDSANFYFNINDIINEEWILDDQNNISLHTDGKKIKFIYNDEIVYDNKEFKLNEKTGEFVIDPDGNNIQGELYLRSVSNDNIVIWYKAGEYKLIKKVVIN